MEPQFLEVEPNKATQFFRLDTVMLRNRNNKGHARRIETSDLTESFSEGNEQADWLQGVSAVAGGDVDFDKLGESSEVFNSTESAAGDLDHNSRHVMSQE